MSREAEILRRLTAQFAKKTLSRIQVNGWHKKISDGEESVQNETHTLRPWASASETNILMIREMIEEDRRLTMWDIAGSTQSIISDDLGYRKEVGTLSTSTSRFVNL